MRFFFFIICFNVVDEDTMLALAHQMYKAGSYEEALEHSNTVYERSPFRTDNLLLLGAIYYQVVFLNRTLFWCFRCCWFISTSAPLCLSILVSLIESNVKQTCHYNVSSCKIMICVYQRMKKLYGLIPIFQSAMETWPMHGR